MYQINVTVGAAGESRAVFRSAHGAKHDGNGTPDDCHCQCLINAAETGQVESDAKGDRALGFQRTWWDINDREGWGEDFEQMVIPWKFVTVLVGYATFTWLIVRDVRAHELPGAVVGLVLAVIFTRLVYKSMRPKSN